MSESAERGHAGLRRVPSGLIALTPGTLELSSEREAHGMLASMERAAAAAIEGGVRAIVVREPSLADGVLLELAQRIRARLHGAAPGEAWLGVHDRLHLAVAAKADGVHLGGTSLGVAAARAVVGPSVAIGVSSHADDGVDYVGADFHMHAPVFEPTSKPLYSRAVLGWDGVERYASTTLEPVFALGGITVERLQARAGEGAPSPLAGVALIGGLWGTDPSPISNGGGVLREVARISETAAQLSALVGGMFPSRGELQA